MKLFSKLGIQNKPTLPYILPILGIITAVSIFKNYFYNLPLSTESFYEIFACLLIPVGMPTIVCGIVQTKFMTPIYLKTRREVIGKKEKPRTLLDEIMN